MEKTIQICKQQIDELQSQLAGHLSEKIELQFRIRELEVSVEQHLKRIEKVKIERENTELANQIKKEESDHLTQ